LDTRVVVANRRRTEWYRVLGRLALAGLFAAVATGAMTAGIIYAALASDLPRLDGFDRMTAVGVTRFEAADGSLVGERYEERRLAVRWEEVPRPLALAFLAAEDARFFEHSGLDFRGIVRAMVTNLFSGGVKEGASTITQQLAKILVGSRRAWSRKVKEAILARRMEDLYTKEQILTWYMNAIYFGHGSYGVQAAAQNYFRKSLSELSLAEMAILAGCPQSPSRVNPALDLPAAKRRMRHILDNMVALGWVEAAEAEKAKAWEFTVYPLRDTWGSQVPDYTEIVRREAGRYDRPEGSWLEQGLSIQMAVDPAAQRLAHEALDEALVDLQMRQGWPGPLAKVSEADKAAFFGKNKRHVDARRVPVSDEAPPLRVGARLLGRVMSVTTSEALVELDAGLVGAVRLETTKWATPWTVQPMVGDGAKAKRDRSAKVSFDGKLTDLSTALNAGDVVMVRVATPPKPAKKAAPKPAKKDTKKPAPKPSKNPKKKTVDEGKAPAPPFALELVAVPMMEGALVSTAFGTSGLDAMATGWDFDRSEVNRAVAMRQVGSTMKPIVYARAYDLGLAPSTLVSGAPFREGNYNPTGARTHEDKIAWVGLAESENAVSLRVFQHVLERAELATWRQWGEALGLPYALEGHTSEVLGIDQTAVGMLSAFSTFANEGRRVSLPLVRKVVARDGRVLERNLRPADPSASTSDTLVALWLAATTPPEVVVSPVTSHLIARNLTAAVNIGTGKKAKSLNREAGGKTGTLAYDVWFAGFTGERAAVAWLGADRRERTLGPSERDNRIYGSTAALPMWVDFMAKIDTVKRGDKRKGVSEVVPPDVIIVQIDPETGLLARPKEDGTYDKTAIAIPHRKGTEPTEMVPLPIEELPIERAEQDF